MDTSTSPSAIAAIEAYGVARAAYQAALAIYCHLEETAPRSAAFRAAKLARQAAADASDAASAAIDAVYTAHAAARAADYEAREAIEAERAAAFSKLLTE